VKQELETGPEPEELTVEQCRTLGAQWRDKQELMFSQYVPLLPGMMYVLWRGRVAAMDMCTGWVVYTVKEIHGAHVVTRTPNPSGPPITFAPLTRGSSSASASPMALVGNVARKKAREPESEAADDQEWHKLRTEQQRVAAEKAELQARLRELESKEASQRSLLEASGQQDPVALLGQRRREANAAAGVKKAEPSDDHPVGHLWRAVDKQQEARQARALARQQTHDGASASGAE
jgi:hypothetical protein